MTEPTYAKSEKRQDKKEQKKNEEVIIAYLTIACWV